MYTTPRSGQEERRLDAAEDIVARETAVLVRDVPALAARAFDHAPLSLLGWLQEAARLAPDEAFTAASVADFLAEHLDGAELVRVEPIVARAWTEWLRDEIERRCGL